MLPRLAAVFFERPELPKVAACESSGVVCDAACRERAIKSRLEFQITGLR